MITIKPVQFIDVTQVKYMKYCFKHLKASQYGTSTSRPNDTSYAIICVEKH